MIICCCNKVTTEQLRNAAQYLTEPTPKLLLNMVGWQSNCAICTPQLVLEAKKAIEEVTKHGD